MRAPSGDKASDSKVCMPAADGWTGCAATAASAVGAAPAAPAAASAATASAAAVSAVSAAAAVIRIEGDGARIGTLARTDLGGSVATRRTCCAWLWPAFGHARLGPQAKGTAGG